MSIKKKITILFLLSLLLMLSLGFWLQRVNEQKNRQITISRYINNSKELLPLIFDFDKRALNRKLNEFNYEEAKKTKGEEIFKKGLGLGELVIIKNQKGLFLKINYLDEEHYFFDKNQKIFKQEELVTNLFLIFDIVILIFIYFSILKIISPIKRLSKSMQKFAKGDFNIQVEITGRDEISLLAKSFNKMALDLKNSFEDRENLLRYFGHEIRTPLAKAQYALEAKDLESIKTNLDQIEKFVEDVLNMHLITSKNLQTKRFLASTLVVEALNKSDIKNENDIEIELTKEFQIQGDLHYLGIALKNLIENALKYSTKFPIKIEIKENEIAVISYGEKLKEGLNHYLKPFNKKSSKGLGLGLSLTHLILKKHRFYLDYFHQNKQNIFKILFKEK